MKFIKLNNQNNNNKTDENIFNVCVFTAFNEIAKPEKNILKQNNNL